MGQDGIEDQAATRVVSYYAARQFGVQWRVFLLGLVTELYGAAEAEDAEAFLREVGGRTARLLPVGKVETLEALEDEINTALGTLDWGFASLAAGDDGVAIRHFAAPLVLPEDSEGVWSKAFPAILEGLYNQWFLLQDGPENLSARFAAIRGGTIELQYGR